MAQYMLTHHGILGMHWGIRRFQPYPSGKSGRYIGKKKKSFLADRKEKKALKKAEKAAKKEKEALEREENEKKAYEEAKAEALKKGTAEDILKFRGDVSNQDMENAIQRIQKERKLEELRDTQITEAERNLAKVMKKAETLRTYTNTAVGLVDNLIKADAAIKKITNADTEKYKQSIIASGDPDKLLKNWHLLNADEKKKANEVVNALSNINKKKVTP